MKKEEWAPKYHSYKVYKTPDGVLWYLTHVGKKPEEYGQQWLYQLARDAEHTVLVTEETIAKKLEQGRLMVI